MFNDDFENGSSGPFYPVPPKNEDIEDLQLRFISFETEIKEICKRLSSLEKKLQNTEKNKRS